MSRQAKKLLIVAYFFPPIGGTATAGALRVVKFAKYLPLSGWTPIVLTAEAGAYERDVVRDPTLLKELPDGLLVVRTSVLRGLSMLLRWKSRVQGAGSEASNGGGPKSCAGRSRCQRLKDGITDLFQIPDAQAGWVLPAAVRGRSLARREDVDAILATGKPWSGLVIGVLLSRLTGRPLYSDFRDPWMTNPFREPASAIKTWAETRLERWVVRRSRRVLCNTDELRDEFRHRFPGTDPQRFVTLTNGFDPDGLGAEERPSVDDRAVFRIVHTGMLYGIRDPENLLRGLTVALKDPRVDESRVELHFYGPVELGYDLPRLVEELGLAKIVRLPGLLPYGAMREVQATSAVLLLLQPGTRTQVPSKLFEYLVAGSPILAIGPADGAAVRMVSEGCLGATASPESADEIAQALVGLYQDWRDGVQRDSTASAAREALDVRRITAELARQLDPIQ